MENMTQDVQITQESFIKTPELGECPTCASGADPSIGTALFQEALRDAL